MLALTITICHSLFHGDMTELQLTSYVILNRHTLVSYLLTLALFEPGKVYKLTETVPKKLKLKYEFYINLILFKLCIKK